MPPEAIIEELKQSAIRGRGGAGFQMGMKASFLPKGEMAKYLTCNADESEPGTFKDRELMQKSPHSLIEGMVITTYGTGIHQAFIYIRGEYQLQADILDAAVAEAEAAGYVGENILGSGHSLKLVVHRGAGAYICGEETGLLYSLEGKRGNPRLKPPFPAIEGLYAGHAGQQRRDLATMPTIINMGADEYAKIGTEVRRAPSWSRVSGRRPASRATTRSSLGDPSPGSSSTASSGGPHGGPQGQDLVPGRLASSPVLTRRRTSISPTTSTRSPRPARCSAPARSSSVDERPHCALMTSRGRSCQVLRARIVRQVRAVPRGPAGPVR